MATTLTVVHEELVQGSGAKPYDVKIYNDGSNYCTCSSWRFQKGKPATERQCKHTLAVSQKLINLLQAIDAVPSDEEDMA